MTKALVLKPEDSQTKEFPCLISRFRAFAFAVKPVYADHACKLNGWTYERLRQQRAVGFKDVNQQEA